MRSVLDRYHTDPAFRALVCVLESAIAGGQYTPTEVREAAILATTLVEQRTIRPMIIPLRELDAGGIIDFKTGRDQPWPRR